MHAHYIQTYMASW